MADTVQPRSFSIYRGQARTGQGEGPEKPVLHGEQYLWVDRELYHPALLDAIRPWMSLDSNPTDHQRLGDRLEAWSLFTAGDYLFVVRLVSAGIYDRRAAYFAHGRAWRSNALPPGFDPGLYLSCSDAFAAPWRDDYPGETFSKSAPSLVWSQDAGDSDAAARILGHLLQALGNNYPLIVAASVSEFSIGGSLHALISLARGALPADLRRECRIRVYSRLPEFFLRHVGANLIVIPEEAAGAALAARPNATLLDRQGVTVAGHELADRALDYAKAVVGRAKHTPGGLPHFSERFQRRFARSRQELPSADDVRAIRITYNLAAALAGTEEDRAAFLCEFLPREAEKLGPGFNWNALIDAREWTEFPREAVLDQLLTDFILSPAKQELLRVVEAGAAARKLLVDDRLAGWWEAQNPHKARRLIELLVHEPPLVSEAAAAQRIAEVPVASLPRSAPLLVAVFRAEAKYGQLARRSLESASLADVAMEPEVLDVLTLATSEGHLDSAWVQTFVRTASDDRLVAAARRWLPDPSFWQAWGNVPKVLLDRLRQLQPPPIALSNLVRDIAERLDPIGNLDPYLALADLQTRIGQAETQKARVALPLKFRASLPRLMDSRSRASLEGLVDDPAWECFRLDSLELSSLLDLATIFRSRETLDALYEQLDLRMAEDAETTTNALVAGGWWYFWREKTTFLAHDAVLQRSAFQWLIANAWSETGPEASLEAWEQALNDLPRNWPGTDFARLCRDGEKARRRWPWIPPFEEDQLTALVERAEDLGALAELAEALRSDRWAASLGDASADLLKKSPRFRDDVSPDALIWLQSGAPDGLEPLDLAESAYLYQHAAHRRDQALTARIRSVASRLKGTPAAAIAAAGVPNLWSDDRFREPLADWMSRKRTLEEIGPSNIEAINGNLDERQAPGTREVSHDLVRQLVDGGYQRAAGFLSVNLSEDAQKANLADKLMEALLVGRTADPGWQQLAAKVKRYRLGEVNAAGRHPLMVLAERIRERPLSREQSSRLARDGWKTFAAASTCNPGLMSAELYEPEGLPQFHLAARMLGPGAIGRAILTLVLADANVQCRADFQWWKSIFRAMQTFRRHGSARSAEDRPHVALAVVRSLDLPEVEQAFERAVKSAAHENTQSALWSEHGEITS